MIGILSESERGRSGSFIQNVLSFKRPILLPGGICWIIRAGEPSTSQELYLHFKRQVLLKAKSLLILIIQYSNIWMIYYTYILIPKSEEFWIKVLYLHSTLIPCRSVLKLCITPKKFIRKLIDRIEQTQEHRVLDKGLNLHSTLTTCGSILNHQ